MLRGENIVCFSKDYSEDPTSNNHVLTLLSEHNKVLWVNSIATRTPKLSSGADRAKILRKLKSFTQGLERINDNLWVFTPIVLPLPHNPIAARINRRILRAAIRIIRLRLGMRDFQAWTFPPTAEPYIGTLGESFSVYYCTDQFSKFDHMDGKAMLRTEEALCRKVDVVFATAHSLVEDKKKWNAETHLASHGVDYEHFAKALDPKTKVAPELADLEGPVIGFFGLIHTWIDQDLIRAIAERHPEWNIVIIGKSDVETSRLDGVENVYMLGRKAYADLPGYCKGMSAGIIPFAINELTHHVNPIKMREYLSAGLPVVSTPLPEVCHYEDICTVAGDTESFIHGLEEAVAHNSPEDRQRRSDMMKKETWVEKVKRVGEIVNEVKARKGR